MRGGVLQGEQGTDVMLKRWLIDLTQRAGLSDTYSVKKQKRDLPASVKWLIGRAFSGGVTPAADLPFRAVYADKSLRGEQQFLSGR